MIFWQCPLYFDHVSSVVFFNGKPGHQVPTQPTIIENSIKFSFFCNYPLLWNLFQKSVYIFHFLLTVLHYPSLSPLNASFVKGSTWWASPASSSFSSSICTWSLLSTTYLHIYLPALVSLLVLASESPPGSSAALVCVANYPGTGHTCSNINIQGGFLLLITLARVQYMSFAMYYLFTVYMAFLCKNCFHNLKQNPEIFPFVKTILCNTLVYDYNVWSLAIYR